MVATVEKIVTKETKAAAVPITPVVVSLDIMNQKT